jgi:four helix bundle protein
MSSIRTFQDLECWKLCRAVRLLIMDIVIKLPKEEQFELVQNLRRAARSATRNIAEGFGRYHFQENIQFCRISRGSLTEIWDDLITCRDDNYISPDEFQKAELIVKQAIKVLNGYIHYLEKSKQTFSEDSVIYGSETEYPELNNPLTK